MVAPSASQTDPQDGTVDESLYDDYPTGYYADGAYTALPIPSVKTKIGAIREDTEEGEQDIDPQIAYYISLSNSFRALREILQSTPDLPAVSNSTKNSSIPTVSSLEGATHATWRYTLLHTTPKMQVLASFPQEIVFRGLQVMETLLTRRNLGDYSTGKNLGAWCWGLLGRCRGVGEMCSEDVGVLRLLGKRALWLAKGLCVGREDVDEVKAEDEWEEQENEEDEGEHARAANENHKVVNEEAIEEVEDGEISEETHHAEDPFETTKNTAKSAPSSPAASGPHSNNAVEHQQHQLQHHNTTLTVPSPQTSEPAGPQDTSVLDPLSLAKATLLSKLTQPSSPAHLIATLLDTTTPDSPGAGAPAPAPAPAPAQATTSPARPLHDKPEERRDEAPTSPSEGRDGDGGGSIITTATTIPISGPAPPPTTAARELETRAMLDMLVTVIGEFYGQRDLLDGREVWGE